MKIYIGSDHAGYELKHYLMDNFKDAEFHDIGFIEFNKDDDYPKIAHDLSNRVLSEKGLGILICGTGLGMCMGANRHKGIRAANCLTPEMAELTRKHNNANILCLSARLIKKEDTLEILKTFLETEFEGSRHEKRVEMLDN